MSQQPQGPATHRGLPPTGPATKFDNLIQFLPTTQQERTDICKLSFDLHMCLLELITTTLSQGNVTLKKYSVIEVTVLEGIGLQGLRQPDVGGLTLDSDAGQGPVIIQANSNDHILF